MDLQEVAQQLGWHRIGLSRIAKLVMGIDMPKNKKVSCSNWAANNLSMQQIKYASLDAFVAGQVFRGLRLWHSSPSSCPGCLSPVGAPMEIKFKCRGSTEAGKEAGCSSTFHCIEAFRMHGRTTGHSTEAYYVCGVCGRAAEKQQQQQPTVV